MAAPQETPRAEATRARLLAAAVSAFAERGYHATTTRDIAAAAGMSPAALYVHHASKEELLYEIARRGHQEVLAALETALGGTDPGAAAGRAAARDRLRLRGVPRALAHLRAGHQLRARGADAGALRRDPCRTPPDRGNVSWRTIERGIGDGSFDLADARMPALAIVSLGVDITRWYHPGGFRRRDRRRLRRHGAAHRGCQLKV